MATKKNNQPDILEEAAGLVRQDEQAAVSSILTGPMSTRDSFYEDIGVLKGLNFSESLLRYVKAVKLYRLYENKRYKKELGIPNFAELCKRIGFGSTTGKKLIGLVQSFGEQGYKALCETNLKQRDLNMLAKFNPEVETTGSGHSITLDGETVEIKPGNEEMLLSLIERQQKEKETLKKEVAAVAEAKQRIETENQELKDRFVREQTEPGADYKNAQSITMKIQDDHLRSISTLRKLFDKHHENEEIMGLVSSTIFYMDSLLVSLKSIAQGIDDDGPGTVLAPEDILEQMGANG